MISSSSPVRVKYPFHQSATQAKYPLHPFTTQGHTRHAIPIFGSSFAHPLSLRPQIYFHKLHCFHASLSRCSQGVSEGFDESLPPRREKVWHTRRSLAKKSFGNPIWPRSNHATTKPQEDCLTLGVCKTPKAAKSKSRPMESGCHVCSQTAELAWVRVGQAWRATPHQGTRII